MDEPDRPDDQDVVGSIEAEQRDPETFEGGGVERGPEPDEPADPQPDPVEPDPAPVEPEPEVVEPALVTDTAEADAAAEADETAVADEAAEAEEAGTGDEAAAPVIEPTPETPSDLEAGEEETELAAIGVDDGPAVDAGTAPSPVEADAPAPAGDGEVVVVEAEPPAPAPSDPFRGPGDWYVVHTYSGYENKVKTNLESRIHTMQMEDKIFGVHIPMEDVMEIKSGKKQVVKKKQFPGYLLVRMVYDNDSWYVVRNTPGVTGFVSAGTGSKPTPLSKHEVEKILAVKKEEVRPQVRLGFEEGDVVRITSGPFADFNGTINEINPDQAKLKVLVNIFDRETPVELSFDQVSKV
jgi:transcriptional antiterminator NusG